MKRNVMKSTLAMALVAACMMVGASLAIAAEKTITGEGKCAKEHQTAVEVKEAGKTVTYYLAQNDVSKKFHSKICSKAAQVKVTGEVKETDGRMEITATSIALVTKESTD